MPELRELKKKGGPPSSKGRPNKLLIGLLSLLVFVLLFVFFRGKKEIPSDSRSSAIDIPSPEEFAQNSEEFPLESFDEDSTGGDPTGGKIRIGPENEVSDQEPLSQGKRIIPIPAEELAFFGALQDQQEIDSSQPRQAPPANPKAIYTIQLGAFKNKKGAQTLAELLRKGGYDAYLLTEKGQLYKVRVGEYRSKEAAKKVADQIRESERLNSFITIDE